MHVQSDSSPTHATILGLTLQNNVSHEREIEYVVLGKGLRPHSRKGFVMFKFRERKLLETKRKTKMKQCLSKLDFMIQIIFLVYFYDPSCE